MKKTKLVIFMAAVYPLFNPKNEVIHGGAEVDVYFIATELNRTGKYDITVLVGDYGQDKIEVYEGIKVRKIKYLDTPGANTKIHKIIRHLSLFNNLLFTRVDVFFTEAACNVLGWMGILGAMIRRKPLVYRIASDSDLDMKRQAAKGGLNFKLFKKGFEKSTEIIAQSVVQMQTLKNLFGRNATIIKNGIALKDKGHLPFMRKEFILWVGRGVKLKQPELFLDMAERVPHEKFIMIMPTATSMNEAENQKGLEYNKSIEARTRLLPNVTFIERVPFDEIQDYFNKAKLFVNTSEYEGFPNVFVQCCMAKTPILSLNVNPDEFITKNKLGSVSNGNVDHAIDFISKTTLVNLEKMGENAYSYVKSNHDIEVVVNQYDELFSKMIVQK